MIYTDQDRKDHIRELQGFLRTIFRYENKLPLLLPDGIFGPETAEAVRSFQQSRGLTVTGQADEETWNLIVNEHRRHLAENRPAMRIDAFPAKDFILNKGSVGDIVIFLQLMLVAIGGEFHNVPSVKVNGIFDTATEDAVKKVQLVSSLAPNGIVNKLTWDAIVILYNLYSKSVFPVETK